ncbi:MAG: cysteine synthase family protein [Erythrobacter sp.]|nr:cysteine synthase family protein [Erythrobacter sp.]
MNSLASLAAYESLVGQTPLVELPAFSKRVGRRVLGKCEFLNPGGSIKDRVALAMIKAAEMEGLLTPGKSTIVEATGGNTGLALAALGAGRGYKVCVTMSSKMDPKKVSALRSFGAEVHVCPYEVEPHSDEHFISVARRIASERENHYFSDQFSNPANLRAHFSTAEEIWSACDRVDAVIAGAGTGGTLMGMATFAKQHSSDCSIVLADPHGSILAASVRGESCNPEPYSVEGIGGDFIPPLLQRSMINEAITVTDAESYSECQWVKENEGLWLGGSSGCIIAAAAKFAKTAESKIENIVVLLPDSGRNYSTDIG